MRVGVYFCRCGGVVSERVDGDEVARQLSPLAEVAYVRPVELACADEGRAEIADDLRRERPDRVVVLACSPREHERTFREVLSAGGMNPYLVQLVNVREQCGWVTPDRAEASAKAAAMARGAVARVRHHQPLEVERIDVNPDVLVIGGGPAGLKAALAVAEAGRQAVLVEQDAILGGLPMRYEELYPRMECGPCVLEPVLAEVLHGPHHDRLEVLLQSEVEEVKGSFGNFIARIRQRPRFVQLDACIGCAECIPPCPVSYPSEVQCGLSERKAMDFVFFGGLPSAPYLDPERCLRTTAGSPCSACLDACTVPGAIDLADAGRVVERTAGAVVLAVGGALYDASQLPALGLGRVPGVVTSLAMERMLSSSGPSGGQPRLPDGRPPASVGIVHCVGSLDERHRDYCSGICCMVAFKLNRLVAQKLPGVPVTHYYKTLSLAGKEEAALWRTATADPGTRCVLFQDLGDLRVEAAPSGRPAVQHAGVAREHDLLVLMPALVPGHGVAGLARILGLATDRHGYLEELHDKVDVPRSKLRGVYLAGACHAPMDLAQAMTQGMAAAGAALSALVPGRQLELEAVRARVDDQACTACYTCVPVCPYHAIDGAGGARAVVAPALCTGCGTCVAACPSGAMHGLHFEDRQIYAEIEGLLS